MDLKSAFISRARLLTRLPTQLARLSMLLVIFFLGTSVLYLTACSSLGDKADALMAEKSYEEAESIYKEILARSPHDTHALIGLKKARQGAISSELIIVRRQRLGGNPEQADEDLRNILLSLKDWKVYPTGAVAFTQNEEMDYAVQDLVQRSRALLSQHHPLKVAYLLDRYSEFFQEKNLPLLKQLRDAANNQGLAACRTSLAVTNKSLTYYREFLAKECVYWGDTRPEMKNPIQHGLFGRLELQGGVPGVPDALRPRLENEIQHFLQQSPWYDSTSNKTLRAAYSGNYSFKTVRHPTEFTHAYQEEEPYNSFELVTKHRAHAVAVSRQEMQPDGHVATVNTTEYRDEPYSEMETITRRRTVTKSFNFPGTEIEQNISLRSVISGKMDDAAAEFRLTANSADRNLTSESQTQVPSMSLYSRQAKIMEENEWFAQILSGWSQQNLEQLRDIWVHKYCQDFQSDWSEAQQGDRVFSCLRERSRAAPAFVDAWLKQNLGVQSLELRAILL